MDSNPYVFNSRQDGHPSGGRVLLLPSPRGTRDDLGAARHQGTHTHPGAPVLPLALAHRDSQVRRAPPPYPPPTCSHALVCALCSRVNSQAVSRNASRTGSPSVDQSHSTPVHAHTPSQLKHSPSVPAHRPVGNQHKPAPPQQIKRMLASCIHSSVCTSLLYNTLTCLCLYVRQRLTSVTLSGTRTPAASPPCPMLRSLPMQSTVCLRRSSPLLVRLV